MRVGIIGYGRWAPNLARNIAKHATVAWVCDPSQDARIAARAAGYGAFDEITSDDWESLDAVAIATPIASHFECVSRALEAGKHVLCEKPLDSFGIGVGVLRGKAYSRGLTLMMSAPWLFHPAIQRAGEVAKDLGAPIWFRAARTSWDERPLDPIADLLPHDVGILKAWTGQRVAELIAIVEKQTAAIAMRTTSGLVATFTYTYREREKLRRVEMGSERGAVYTDGTNAFDVERDGERKSHIAIGGPEPLDAMCAEFVDCCRTGRTPRFGNVDDALHVAEVIEAAHRSVAEMRVVTL